MNDKMRPALIGGAILGVLSAIPFVGALNICCCAWAIVGGVIATNLYVKGSTTPAGVGDGAVVGLIAGVIGAAIYLILGIPLGIITGNATLGLMTNIMGSVNPQAAEQMRAQAEQMQNLSTGELLVASLPGALIGAVCLIIFSAIGGMIGVPIFEKRKGGDAGAPPPPQGFGGGAPGAGGGYGS